MTQSFIVGYIEYMSINMPELMIRDLDRFCDKEISKKERKMYREGVLHLIGNTLIISCARMERIIPNEYIKKSDAVLLEFSVLSKRIRDSGFDIFPLIDEAIQIAKKTLWWMVTMITSLLNIFRRKKGSGGGESTSGFSWRNLIPHF